MKKTNIVSNIEHNAFLCFGYISILFAFLQNPLSLNMPPHVSLLKSDKPKPVGFLFFSSLYKSMFLLLKRMKTKQNISNASGPLWFLRLWITMYFPMFMAKNPKSTKVVDRHAKDPTLGESLRIKSTTSDLAHFFIEAIFGILDDIGALWNPSTINHVVHD